MWINDTREVIIRTPWKTPSFRLLPPPSFLTMCHSKYGEQMTEENKSEKESGFNEILLALIKRSFLTADEGFEGYMDYLGQNIYAAGREVSRNLKNLTEISTSLRSIAVSLEKIAWKSETEWWTKQDPPVENKRKPYTTGEENRRKPYTDAPIDKIKAFVDETRI